MSFTTTLNSKCQEYTNMVIGGTRIQLPYHWGGKNLPSVIGGKFKSYRKIWGRSSGVGDCQPC